MYMFRQEVADLAGARACLDHSENNASRFIIQASQGTFFENAILDPRGAERRSGSLLLDKTEICERVFAVFVTNVSEVTTVENFEIRQDSVASRRCV